MSKWHYICKEDINFPGNDIRSGEYYDYHVDTFDYLINDKDWVAANDAFDESDYILDHLDKMLESNDGSIVFIPTAKTATRIDTYYEEVSLDEAPY